MNNLVLDARVYQRDINVSDMLFKDFSRIEKGVGQMAVNAFDKVTGSSGDSSEGAVNRNPLPFGRNSPKNKPRTMSDADQKRADDYSKLGTQVMPGYGTPDARRPPERTMSDQELSEGVDSALNKPQSSKPQGNFTERLNALRPQTEPQPEPQFDGSMFNIPEAKGPEMPANAPAGTQMVSGRADYSKVSPTNNPEKEASGAQSQFGGFDSEGFRDMFGQDAANAPYQNKRMKTGGFARNLADSAMDRLTAARTGKNPFSSKGAAAGQRERFGIDQSTQADRVSRQTANMADEKARRVEGKKAARFNAATVRAPGAGGLSGGREQQEAMRAATTEEPAQSTTAAPQEASTNEGMSVEDAKRALVDTASDEKPKTGAPLFGGKEGGVKIPGWRGAADYAKKNPGKAGLMAGLPAAAGFLGGLAEGAINLGNRGYQEIQARKNPNLKRASHDMLEYSPELAMLIKSQTQMRQLRDARSTEVIRYAYG